MSDDQASPKDEAKLSLYVRDTRVMFPAALFVQTVFLVWFIAHRDAQLEITTIALTKTQVMVSDLEKRIASIEPTVNEYRSRLTRLESSDDNQTRFLNEINQQLTRIDERLRLLIERVAERSKN